MNILVLENDPREAATIQQALSGVSNAISVLTSSAQVLQAIQAGGVQFLIADQDSTDIAQTQLIQRIRSEQLAEPVYILLISSSNPATDAALKSDDVLHRPYVIEDLKNRIEVARRIISLTSKLNMANRQLEDQAIFDPLTSFMNRTGFLRQATGELERSRRASLPLSLIALDIDNFKIINDRFGETLGDQVLEVVAKSIRDKSRPYDCIGRWTGDEFVLALPGVIGADAEKVAERIIAGVRGTRMEVPNEPPLNVKVSAGIAAIMRITTTTEIEPIIQSARQAVALAKEAGGNQVFLSFL
jgi:diguanylate cyclase (GGDEF)-like protein